MAPRVASPLHLSCRSGGTEEDFQKAMRTNESDGTKPKAAPKRDRRVSTAPTRARAPRGRQELSIARPDHEQIRFRAYEIYCRRNGFPGDPQADWLLAERELMAELPSSKTGRRARVTKNM